jgi:HSP20 family protein
VKEKAMAIVRWDPFRELSDMQSRMNRLFGEFYGRRSEDDLIPRSTWWPPVDIYENDHQELVIRAELPDMQRDDIKLVVDNNILTISGEKKFDSEMKDENCHRVERTYGQFSRSFSLPTTIDSGKVSAEYKNGVLTVKLPKREEAKPKQIAVKVD